MAGGSEYVPSGCTECGCSTGNQQDAAGQGPVVDSSEYNKTDNSLVDLDTGILLMQEFLQEIGEGFNAPHLDDEEKRTEQPIRCLGELSLPKWFGESYHSKKLESETQNENGPEETTRFFLAKLEKNNV